MPWKYPSRWAGIVLVLAALILYLLTLDNGLRPGELEGGDLITHQYAQVQARPSNAPGYPLYTLGGWAWFHGVRSLLGQHANPTAILSAYSTLWALLALWLLYQLIVDLTGNWGIGLLLGAFYAVTYFFWYYAVSTEQYTSAVAQTLAIVLLAFRWEATQDRADREGRYRTRRRRLSSRIGLFGRIDARTLVTVAFVVPPLLWFVLSRRPGLMRRPRLVAAAIGSGAAAAAQLCLCLRPRGATPGVARSRPVAEYVVLVRRLHQHSPGPRRADLVAQAAVDLRVSFTGRTGANLDRSRRRPDRPSAHRPAARPLFGQYAPTLRRVQLCRPAGQLVPGRDAGLRPAGDDLRRHGRVALAGD